MSDLPARREPSRPVRRYRLPGSPAAALARLAESGQLVVMSAAEARSSRRRASKPWLVIESERFVLYQPWAATLVTPEGALVEDLVVGPAVVGRVVADPEGDGCVVEVEARRFAPTPAQARRIGGLLAAALGVLAVMLIAAGPHPLLLAIAVIVTTGTVVGALGYRRAQRSRDIRELLAIVEGRFAPLELAAGDAGPNRSPG